MPAPHMGKRAAFDGSFVLWGGGGPIGRIDCSAWSSPGREAPMHGKGGERRWERARRLERGGERRWRDVHKRGGSVVCVAVCRPCPRSPVVARQSRGFSRHHSLQAGKKGLVMGMQLTCVDVDRPERNGKYPEDAFPFLICRPVWSSLTGRSTGLHSPPWLVVVWVSTLPGCHLLASCAGCILLGSECTASGMLGPFLMQGRVATFRASDSLVIADDEVAIRSEEIQSLSRLSPTFHLRTPDLGDVCSPWGGLSDDSHSARKARWRLAAIFFKDEGRTQQHAVDRRGGPLSFVLHSLAVDPLMLTLPLRDLLFSRPSHRHVPHSIRPGTPHIDIIGHGTKPSSGRTLVSSFNLARAACERLPSASCRVAIPDPASGCYTWPRDDRRHLAAAAARSLLDCPKLDHCD